MEYVKLGNYINIKTGKLDANKNTVNGKYPFFTCSKVTLRINTYSYDCECVLVAGNGEINAKYYNGKFDAYQRTYIIESKDKSKLLVKYIYYFMLSYIDILKRKSIGGVIKYIKLNNLTEAIIPLISIAEQKKIINYFEKYNKYVDYNKILLNDLDNIVKSQFIELFNLEVAKNNGWEILSLKEVLEHPISGEWGTEDLDGTGIKVLRTTNFTDYGVLDLHDVTTRNIEYSKVQKKILKIDDILIEKSGGSDTKPVGRVVRITQDDESYLFNNFTALLRVKDERLNPRFVFDFMFNNYKMDGTKKYENKTTGIHNLKLDDYLLGTMIPIPSEDVQREYICFAEQSDKSKYFGGAEYGLY